MTGLGIFLCWLFIGFLFVVFFTIKYCKKPSVVRVCKYLGFGILISIIPAIILAWPTRNVLPNVYQIHDNSNDCGVRYCFMKDFYSGCPLDFTENYITNASNEPIYVIRVHYSKDRYSERPKSELIYKLEPNTTVQSDLYIGRVFPKSIGRTRSKSTKRHKVKTYHKINSEIIVLKQDHYVKEMQRILY